MKSKQQFGLSIKGFEEKWRVMKEGWEDQEGLKCYTEEFCMYKVAIEDFWVVYVQKSGGNIQQGLLCH